MSKKCPYCGSYNTEISMKNFAERAAVNAGRYALAFGAALVGGIFSHTIGHAAAHSVLENTKPSVFKGYRCCEGYCGKDFSA